MVVMEFYFVGGWQCFAIFQCRRIAYEWTCTWSWSWEYGTSLTKVKEFDKTQSEVKLHMKVWEWKSNFGFGRNFHYFEETSYWWVFLRNPKYFAKKSMVPLIQSYRISQLLRKHGSLWKYLFTWTRKKTRNKKYARLFMEAHGVQKCIGKVQWV